jgi:hypothetical protein
MLGCHVAAHVWATWHLFICPQNVPLVEMGLDHCHLPSQPVDALPRVSMLRHHDDVMLMSALTFLHVDFLSVWENE